MKEILFADDDLNLLRLYYDEFSEEGYKVILAQTGKEALMKFKKELPDLVVLGIRMPGMNGIETLNAILGHSRQALVILHTAYPQYRMNFMTWGAEAFVVKSPDLTELKRTIREVLDGRKKTPQSIFPKKHVLHEKRSVGAPINT